MTFLIFLAALAIAYFAWRIVDQLPDLVYRLSEIQRDVAEVRRRLEDNAEPAQPETSQITAEGDQSDTEGSAS